jgi:hypothetical protein
MLTNETMSYYVHSSIIYSDGAKDCSPPVLPDNLIIICPKCSKEFWKEDTIMDTDSEDLDFDLPYAKDVHDLHFALKPGFNFELAKYYAALLKEGFANTMEQEIYIRIEIWRSLNNIRRHKNKSDFIYLLKGKFQVFLKRNKIRKQKKMDQKNARSLFESNLKRLIDIYIPEHDGELLLLAEMHRELGAFSKAIELLGKINNDKDFPLFLKIQNAAKRNQSKLISIKS